MWFLGQLLKYVNCENNANKKNHVFRQSSMAYLYEIYNKSGIYNNSGIYNKPGIYNKSGILLLGGVNKSGIINKSRIILLWFALHFSNVSISAGQSMFP